MLEEEEQEGTADSIGIDLAVQRQRESEPNYRAAETRFIVPRVFLLLLLHVTHSSLLRDQTQSVARKAPVTIGSPNYPSPPRRGRLFFSYYHLLRPFLLCARGSFVVAWSTPARVIKFQSALSSIVIFLFYTHHHRHQRVIPSRSQKSLPEARS